MTFGPECPETLDRLLHLMREYRLDTLGVRQGARAYKMTMRHADQCAFSAQDIASAAAGLVMLHHPVQAKPLVQVGDQVDAGKVLAMIGQGPLYTVVRAPRAGTIARIVAQQGAAIAAGEPLMSLA